MRFISFSILFAIFTIVFHGVVAQAPHVAKNSVQGHLNRMHNHLRDAQDLREKAKNCIDERQKARYEKQAELKEQHAHARLAGAAKASTGNDALHLKRAHMHRENEKKYQELANHATTEAEKARWTREAARAKRRYNYRINKASGHQ